MILKRLNLTVYIHVVSSDREDHVYSQPFQVVLKAENRDLGALGFELRMCVAIVICINYLHGQIIFYIIWTYTCKCMS